MQTEFRAIVHGEYGAAEDVLRLAECQFKSEELGPDHVLVQVTARPVHHGDIQMLSALPQGGPVVPIPEGTLRVPAFEGVGTIVRLGTNPEVANRFREGQRVAFFPAMGSWAEYVVVPYNSLVPVPDEIPDQIAGQMLINTITASVRGRTRTARLSLERTPLSTVLRSSRMSSYLRARVPESKQ